MALGGGDEADRAVAVLVVVPVHQAIDPVAGGGEVGKGLQRIGGAVFEGFEQRFRVRVVVADRRSAEGGHDAEALQGGQHRRAFHRAAIVGMQGDLLALHAFAMAHVAQQPRWPRRCSPLSYTCQPTILRLKISRNR